MTYSTNSPTRSQVKGENEKLLEFHLLLGRILKKRGRAYRWNSDDFDIYISAKGDKFKVETYFQPVDLSEFICVDLKRGKDNRFYGKFIPFYILQEEVEESDVGECEGSDAEKSLLLFLSHNLQFSENLDEEMSNYLSKILRKRIIDLNV